MKLTAAQILRFVLKIMKSDEASAEAEIKYGMFFSRPNFLKLFLFTNIAFFLLSKMVQLISMISHFLPT